MVTRKPDEPAKQSTAGTGGPEPAATPVIMTSIEQFTDTLGARLRIHVDIQGEDGDRDCLPAASEIMVLCGGKQLESKLVADGDCLIGTYDVDNALAEVVAAPFTCKNSCRCYVPLTERTAILLKRGCTADLSLSYLPGTSTIYLTPVLVESPHGQVMRAIGSPSAGAYGNGGLAAYGAIEAPNGAVPVRRELPGVRVLLYDGPKADGKPLVRTTTEAQATLSFTGLEPGIKTLVVQPPKQAGAVPVELLKPENATYRISVTAGQTLVLDGEFEFQPSVGGVTVRVLDSASGASLARVPVRLVPLPGLDGAQPATMYSEQDGTATFSDVPSGPYRIALAAEAITVDGVTWVAAEAPTTVRVTARDRGPTAELLLTEDRHLVRGTVLGPDERPLAGVRVEIRAEDGGDLLDSTYSDANGRYELETHFAGDFFLSTGQQNGQVVQVSIGSTVDGVILHAPPPFGTTVFGDGSSDGGSSGGVSSNGSSTLDEDPTPFPLLVGNVDLTEGTAPSRGGGGGYSSGHSGYGSAYGSGGSAGATVSAAIRDVLGYRTKTTDTKGFVNALQRSFTCMPKDGYTVCAWTPRSYAATIPSDLGALTGAQASIYERARVTVDATLPLLDGLTSLLAAPDNQDVEAIRAIVRSRLVELVAELALEGGPRTQRVDELFERLTGLLSSTNLSAIQLLDVNQLAGELGVLSLRFGMNDRRNVNLLAEEENFTNFLIIVDNVSTLFVSWQQTRAFFDRSVALQVDDNDQDAPFLGTQLVLISRQLNVVSETVKETYFAMDSVFLGPAERQTVLLRLNDEGGVATTILLSELLDWVDRFATDEGPQLIEEAGTDGINALVPTLNRLSTLVASAVAIRSDPLIPPTFFTARVQLALGQLAGQLGVASTLAQAVFDRLGLGDILPDSNGSSSSRTSSRNVNRGGRR